MTKGVHPPKTLTKRGKLHFVDRQVFDVHVVVGINPTAQQDVCASTVHYSSHMSYSPSLLLLYQNSQHPTACGTSTLVSKRSNVRTGNISDLRTASVCFIQEEPHNIPFVLNRGRIQLVIRACPVTTGCIVAMS